MSLSTLEGKELTAEYDAIQALQIEELHRSSVKMKDAALVLEKISQMIKYGQKKLQVVTDFDLTLSRYHKNGKRCSSSHDVIESNPRMSSSYRANTKALVDKYYPIESDPNINYDLKLPLMIDWWTLAHEELCDTKLNENDIKPMVQESSILLRDGCQTFLQTLHEYGILVIIFSAGLGNVIEEVLHQQFSLHDNMHIISNYMVFNKYGQLTGFRNELIHSLNKNSAAFSKLDCYAECLAKPCVILLGDNLGDSNMVNGLESVQVTLKIGFLNRNVETSLDKYLDHFDIVLIDDQTLDVVNAIVRKVLQIPTNYPSELQLLYK